jgi:2-polyprenyl-3-methyl-5-hydroxy-6-metoxy-1,4-benzoquinol methylase
MSIFTFIEKRWVKRMLALTTPKSRPNLNELAKLAKNVRLMELNIKAFGYDLARRMEAALPAAGETQARPVGLKSKTSTQADIESDWVRHWASELKTAVIYHRKLWEMAFVLQGLFEHGHIREGARGLGFGCGVEPHPSYLASRGVQVTITDLDQQSASALGWIDTDQHAATLDQAFHPHLVSRDEYDSLVDFRVADMNAIPAELRGYDFCWSMCAVEHLGSIEKGLAFLRNALATLRPGGLSIHTLEFNVEDDGPTIDHWLTVLFQRRHLEAIAAQLRREGHDVAELDFDYGTGPLDKFIDIPPYAGDPKMDPTSLVGNPLHLKLGIDGFVATCFGLIVRKAA